MILTTQKNNSKRRSREIMGIKKNIYLILISFLLISNNSYSCRIYNNIGYLEIHQLYVLHATICLNLHDFSDHIDVKKPRRRDRIPDLELDVPGTGKKTLNLLQFSESQLNNPKNIIIISLNKDGSLRTDLIHEDDLKEYLAIKIPEAPPAPMPLTEKKQKKLMLTKELNKKFNRGEIDFWDYARAFHPELPEDPSDIL